MGTREKEVRMIVPKVAILVATRNGMPYLKNQLHSLLWQADVEVSIYVSDDCSTDGSLDVLHQYEARFENIKVISHSKVHGSASANFFYLIRNVDLEGYDYVCFADQDDTWFPDKISASIGRMEARSASATSSSVFAFWPSDRRVQFLSKCGAQSDVDYWFHPPGPGCSELFTVYSFLPFQRFVIQNKKALCDITYHDWLAYAFYRYAGETWLIDSSPGFLYTQHENNQIGANNYGFGAILSRIRLARSGWYRNQINLMYQLVSGSEANLIDIRYVLRNFFKIRRSKRTSALFSIAFLIRIF